MDDWLANAGMVLTAPLTIYTVNEVSKTTVTQDTLTAGAGPWVYNYFGNAGTRWQALAGSAIYSSATVDTNFHVFSTVQNAAASTFSYDGVVGSTGTLQTGSQTGVYVGAYSDGTAPITGSIACVLIYFGAHDANTRKKVTRWLGRQFNVAVTQ